MLPIITQDNRIELTRQVIEFGTERYIYDFVFISEPEGGYLP